MAYLRWCVGAYLLVTLALTASGQTSSTWQDNANGQMFDCNGMDPGGVYTFPDNNLWSQEEVFSVLPDCGPTPIMTQPSNWSTPNYPDNGNGASNYDVVLGGPANTELNISVTIDSLVVGAAGHLDIRGATSLGIADGLLTNNSQIVLNSNTVGSATTLRFDVPSDLNGSGDILLNYSGSRAQITTATGATVTQGANHRIHGSGNIAAEFINNGIVEADGSVAALGSSLLLLTNDKTNNNIFRAATDSTLAINSITVTQNNTTGRIIAAGGTVQLNTGTTINEGRLETSGDGIVESAGQVVLNNVTNLGAIDVKSASSFRVDGGMLTNNGSITLNSNVSGTATSLHFLADGELAGTGDLLLNYSGSRARITAAENVTVTQAATHTIHGSGLIDAPFINNGIVEADASVAALGTDIVLSGDDKTNNSIMRALTGSQLSISSITLTQDDQNGRIIASDGTVKLNTGTTVVDGRIESTGTGVIESTGTVVLDDVELIGDVEVKAASNFRVTGGTLTNNSDLILNSTNVGSATSMHYLESGELTGTGSVLLNYSGSRARITSETGATVTQQSGHRIFGSGQIAAPFVNNGVVEADGSAAFSGTEIVLDTNDKQNNHILRALAGSTLHLSSVTVTQDDATGRIIADEGVVKMSGSSKIVDGTLETVGAGVFELIGTPTLQDVTAEGPVNILAGATLTVDGASFVNNSTTTVNSSDGNVTTTMRFDSNVIINGSGEILLHKNSRARLQTVAGTTVTQASSHTIRGEGIIEAALNNFGIVESFETPSSGTAILDLTFDEKQNHHIMRANSATELRVSGATIMQDDSTGQIVALDGGLVSLRGGATIVGGLLKSEGTGVVESNSGGATLQDVTLEGDFHTRSGITTTITGTELTNNGEVLVNSNNGNVVTNLSFDGNVLLSGTGNVTLGREATRARVTTTEGSSVTQAFGHTIRGEGQIDGRLINDGIVEAFDTPGSGAGILELLGEQKTNNHLMQALDGTTLRVGNGFVQQNESKGQIVALNGGTVELRSGAHVRNGRIRSEGTGVVEHDSGAATLEDVTIEGTFNTIGGRTTTVAGSLITNNGTMTVNSNTLNSSTSLFASDSLTFTGTGEIHLPMAIRSQLTGDTGVMVTNGASHTIRGAGTVGVDVRNHGRMEGSSPTELLDINSTVSGLGVLKDVHIDGAHSPGLSPGGVTVEGVYELSNTATLHVEIGGLVPGNHHDQVNSTGTVELAGTLDVELIDIGNGIFVPEVNDTFTILTTTSPIIGTFTTESLPTSVGSSQISWAVEYSPLSVVLRAISVVTLDGDYNGDGTVNLADYTVWRDNLGATGLTPYAPGDGDGDGDVDQSDYAVWKSTFGTTLSVASSQLTTVPEPGCLLLTLFGVSLALACRPRFSRRFPSPDSLL